MSKSEELAQAFLSIARMNHKDTYHKIVYSDEWAKFKEHFNSLESELAAVKDQLREAVEVARAAAMLGHMHSAHSNMSLENEVQKAAQKFLAKHERSEFLTKHHF